MDREREKLKALNLKTPDYPKHVALESTAYGFDVLSLDENEKEIFIEAFD